MDNSMMAGARKLMTVCTALQPGENVVIVTDPETQEVAVPLHAAAVELGAIAVTCLMPTRSRHGEEPPLPVARALAAADVFFVPVRISITHTRAVKEAASAGARGLVLTDFRPEMLVKGGIQADFARQAPICRRLAEIFQQGRRVHLTTPGGTDLHLDATGRRGNALTGIVHRGQFSTIPTIEANFSPLEGSAAGVIVADASIPYAGIGLLREPVRAEVNQGFITAISGGAQAALLREILESQHDPNVYNIAELGVGLNPAAQLCGLMLEDEGVLGMVHIGIGTSITLGGVVQARLHYDLLMRGATLLVDDRIVLRDGQLA